MSFSVNGALFKQSAADWQKRMGDRYEAGKNYPEFDGVLNVPADQAYALAQYLMNATPQGDRQEIPVRLSGWAKTANSGTKYLSIVAKPDYKVQKAIEDAAAAGQAADAAAANLAQATGGAVSEVIDADLF
jgi:hypothetical protein